MSDVAEATPDEELAAAFKVRVNPLVIIAPPMSVRVQLRRALGIQYDWPTEEDMDRARHAACKRASYLAGVRAIAPNYVPEPAEAPSVERDEAIVREGKKDFHIALLGQWGIPLPEAHPTNPGITAMRIKNACLHALRKGRRV